jgi:hypothetical protein
MTATQLTPVRQLTTVRIDRMRPQQRVSLTGTICETETVRAGSSPVCRCVLAGDSEELDEELDLLFLGRATIAGLTVGTRCRIWGTVAVHCDRLAVWNPRYQVEP